MFARVHVSCQTCVEYDGIRAAVHVTILVLQEHLTKFENRPGRSCEVCDFDFLFAIYIVQDYISW